MIVTKTITKDVKCCNDCPYYFYEDGGMNDIFSYCTLLNTNEGTGKFPTLISEIDNAREVPNKCPIKE
jgi:hypothetical protein